MITLVCTQCRASLPVPESKLGSRVFICPQCAYPMETPTSPGAATGITAQSPALEPKQASSPPMALPAPRRAVDAENRGSPKSPSFKGSLRKWSLFAGGVTVVAGISAAMFFSSRTLPVPPAVPVAEKVAPSLGAPAITGPPESVVEKRELKPATVPELIKTVKTGTTSERTQALRILSGQGPEARPALAVVLEAVGDADESVGKLAREVVAKLGPARPEEIPIYGSALRDPAVEVRLLATHVLGQSGSLAKAEIGFLRVLSIDSDPQVQEAAKKAVRRIEDEVLGSLIAALQEKNATKRTLAAQELAEMGPYAKSALPQLVETLQDKNGAVRLAVLDAFLAIGPDAVLVLGESLRDADKEVCVAALRGLARMGSETRPVLPAMVTLLGTTSDARVRREIIQSLGEIGDFAVPYLVQAIEREKASAQHQPYVDALVKIGPDAASALEKTLKYAKPEVKAVAEAVIKKTPPAKTFDKVHKGMAGTIQSNLRLWFVSSDADKDGQLDKLELARAIRGPKAKAYDEGAAGRQLTSRDFAAYPDFAFLSRVDRDNDGFLSRDEYNRWAYDYAEYLWHETEARDRVAKAQLRLMERSLSTAMKVQTEAVLRNEWAQYHAIRRNQKYAAHTDWMQRHLVSLPRR